MLKQSDPKVQQYTEIQFPDSKDIYLRFCDTAWEPNWNLIGIQWYIMDQGSWKILLNLDELERTYQLWLKLL